MIGQRNGQGMAARRPRRNRQRDPGPTPTPIRLPQPATLRSFSVDSVLLRVCITQHAMPRGL
eukprot:3375602-Rhodomonas_salina.1